MAIARECVCCKEIPVLIGKVSEDKISGASIIMYPGFIPVLHGCFKLRILIIDRIVEL